MQNKKPNRERIHYLSLLNVVSAFAVVLLHTNGCFWNYSNERYWLTANIIESVMYFAVPVFFMISGATLLEYQSRYDTIEYFKKRSEKVLLPFFVWSIFGVLYAVANGNYTILSITGSSNSFIDAVIHTKAVGIYWFFIPLFRIYLLIPLLAFIKRKWNDKVLLYIMLISFLVDFFVCCVGTASQLERIEIDKMGLYLTYVIAGYFIHKYELSRRLKRFIYALGFLGLSLHMGGTYILSLQAGTVVQTFKGYANIPCVLYSIAVFILLKELSSNLKQARLISVIECLSGYTFAVYLLHWFILDSITGFLRLPVFSIYYRLGMPTLILLLCIIITWLIRKIPYLNKLLP